MFATENRGAIPLTAGTGYAPSARKTIESARQLVAESLVRQAKQTHSKQPAMPQPSEPKPVVAKRPAVQRSNAKAQDVGLVACLKSFSGALLETVGLKSS